MTDSALQRHYLLAWQLLGVGVSAAVFFYFPSLSLDPAKTEIRRKENPLTKKKKKLVDREKNPTYLEGKEKEKKKDRYVTSCWYRQACT